MTSRHSSDTKASNMNKSLRVFPTLVMSLMLSSPSFADGPKGTVGCPYEVFPKNLPNEGILFVDHSRKGRSGHLGHALVEYEDGKILAFYPNCSDDNKGHSAVGWMEYKRSEDGYEDEITIAEMLKNTLSIAITPRSENRSRH